jgi:beta-lactamase class A
MPVPQLPSLRRVMADFSGVLAVAARAEDTGEVLAVDADRVMPTASVIKLAILAEVFRQEDAGALSLREPITLQEANRAGGSGVLKDLSAGLTLPLLDYATLMITVSDNTATNTLIDRLGGVAPVNHFMADVLGLATIQLNRKVTIPASAEPGGPRPPLGLGSPRHLMELASLTWQRRLVSPRASEQMLSILGRQHYLDQVPRLLDCHPLSPSAGPPAGIAVANKTGMADGARADAGLLLLGGRAVSYAVMSVSADTSLHPDHDGMLANAAAGVAIAERFWPGPGRPPVRATAAAAR